MEPVFDEKITQRSGGENQGRLNAYKISGGV